jgi:dihydroxyacetone kinase
MKKVINDPADVVAEALTGMALAHPDLLEVHRDPDFITRRGGAVSGKVAVLSGGGSGHEPLHGGFVGHGMLSAACPGAIFTSPTPDQIEAATKAVDGGAGVLHLVKNYTGDVLNFETGAELAMADGIEVASVVIDDDVAVKDSLFTAGRRGVGGTVLIERSRVPRPNAATTSRLSPQSPSGPGPPSGRSAWRLPLVRSRTRASRPSSSARTRWRSGSASTASRVGYGWR